MRRMIAVLAATACTLAAAQELPGTGRPSAPECPRSAIDHADKERYYTKAFHYGSADKKEFCVELIDREQKSATGGECRVQIECKHS